ncbi:MAG: glycosyltransferase family 4 protein [Methermicoccaceae archaeon]
MKEILIMNWRGPGDSLAGGSETYLFEIVRRLSDRYNFTMLCRNPNIKEKTKEGGSYKEDHNMRVVRVGGQYTLYPLAAITYLLRLRKHVDLVIDNINGIPFFTPLYVRKPKIAIIHHLVKEVFFIELPYPLALLGAWIERRIPLLYRKVPMGVVSESTKEDLLEWGVPEDRLYLLGEGISPPVLKDIPREQNPTLLYVGRLKNYKRVNYLVEAAVLIKEKFPDITVWIAGGGDAETEVRKRIQELDAEGYVHLLGFVNEETKRELMQRAWIFVMPSLKEGFGLTVAEAEAYGCCAVGFDVPGIRDSIRDGYSGVLVKEQNPQALANAIMELFEKDKWKELGEQAREWASQFTWDAVAERMVKLIEREWK